MTPPFILAARGPFTSPGIEAFSWPSVFDIHVFGLDLSINRVVLLAFLGVAVLSVLFLLAFRKPKVVPTGLQNAMEYGVDFVRNQIVLPVMGPKNLHYLPYLTTLFFFILIMNMMEIIPFINFPVTSRFGIPLFLALLTWVIFLYVGAKSQGLGHYLKSSLIPSGVPIFLMPMIIPIEFVSNFLVRPATLAIRLLANMIAGHLLLSVAFFGTAWFLSEFDPLSLFGIATAAISVGLVGFELFVAGLQAFIFTTLTAVYIAGSQESH